MNAAWRVRDILTDPAGTWARIGEEPGDVAQLLAGYVAPLAAVPAVFGLLGTCVVGALVPNAGLVRATPLDGIFGALFGYVLACAGTLLLGLLIAVLAPMFGARRDFDSAFKLAIYSLTPVWLAGVFLLAPGLRFLGLLGCYGIYLLWTGLPRLVRMPPRRRPGYAAAIVACAVVLIFVAAAAQRALFGVAGL